jgi:hypothetical protein
MAWLTGGGGAGFCWLAMWARIIGGTSWPPPDLVFTIWSLEKYISERCIELMHNKITLCWPQWIRYNSLYNYPKVMNFYRVMRCKIMKLFQQESPQLEIYNLR